MTAEDTTPGIRVADDLAELLVDTDRIRLWGKSNPKRHDIAAIDGSMRDHTVYLPVVAQTSSGRVIVGNGRAETMLAAGLPKLPVVWLDVDDATAAKIVLRDNKTFDDGGGYDQLALAELLDWVGSQQDGSLAGTGYSEAEHAAIMEDLARAAESGSLLASGSGLMLAGGEDEDGPVADSADLFDADEPDRYREQYAVLVVCSDEEDQEVTYAKLKSIGYNCRVVTT
jgi:hypothetical protein